MEEISLTTTSFARMASAPRARHVVTMTGSICGVIPTATEIENSSASSQSPLVRPQSTKTMGHMTSMKPTRTRETEATPASKLVVVGRASRALAMPPR